MNNSTLPEWPHFARPQLAERYLAPVLQFGVRAVTLFAGRGIGKTAFIQQDLLPLARAQGFVCAYVDLWDCPEGPAAGIARALEAAAKGKTSKLAARAKRLLPGILGELGAEVSALGQGAAVRVSLKAKQEARDAEQGERMLDAFDALVAAAAKRQIMLVLDEAQTLAAPKHEALVRALRACFQRHDERIVRVFTGSSRMGLERMFRRSRAALFGQGGQVETFPPLGEAFVRAIAGWFAERTGGAELGEREAIKGFAKLHYSARLFRTAVESVLVGRAPNIASACQALVRDLLHDDVLKTRLSTLTDLQQLVLRLVWEEGRDLFGERNLDRLARTLGRKIAPAQVQTALKRLERLELIYRQEHGEYRIELPELEVMLEQAR
jgi:uncharacterized protein